MLTFCNIAHKIEQEAGLFSAGGHGSRWVNEKSFFAKRYENMRIIKVNYINKWVKV